MKKIICLLIALSIIGSSAMYILKINTLGNVESDTIRIFDNYGNVYKVTISTGVDTVNIYEGD